MDFSSMNKEQRQYMVLGVLVSLIVIYALFAFALTPFLKGWEEVQVEYTELQQKLDEGRRSVNRTSSLLQNLDSSFTNLMAMAESYIAPNQNAYSWVTEQIYRHARELNIDIDTISEYPPNLPWTSSPAVTREFGAYGVRLVTTCGYNKLRELIAAFEQSNPLLVVSGVSVSPSANDYENHRVQVFLEWPIWTSPEAEDLIRSSNSSEPKASAT